jgi:integrase
VPLTVAEAVTAYLDWLDHHGKAARAARHRAENDIIPKLGELRVDRLTTEILERWLHDLAARPRKVRGKNGSPARSLPPPQTSDEKRRRKATANRIWTVLRAALNKAFRAKRVSSDSVWRTVAPFRKVDGARLRILSRDEARRFIAGCAPDFRALATAALLSGCRYGELTRLRVGDFNPKAGTLHVAESKSGEPRHITLTAEAAHSFHRLTAGRPGGDIMFIRTDAMEDSRSDEADAAGV